MKDSQKWKVVKTYLLSDTYIFKGVGGRSALVTITGGTEGFTSSLGFNRRSEGLSRVVLENLGPR